MNYCFPKGSAQLETLRKQDDIEQSLWFTYRLSFTSIQIRSDKKYESQNLPRPDLRTKSSDLTLIIFPCHSHPLKPPIIFSHWSRVVKSICQINLSVVVIPKDEIMKKGSSTMCIFSVSMNFTLGASYSTWEGGRKLNTAARSCWERNDHFLPSTFSFPWFTIASITNERVLNIAECVAAIWRQFFFILCFAAVNMNNHLLKRFRVDIKDQSVFSVMRCIPSEKRNHFLPIFNSKVPRKRLMTYSIGIVLHWFVSPPVTHHLLYWLSDMGVCQELNYLACGQSSRQTLH